MHEEYSETDFKNVFNSYFKNKAGKKKKGNFISKLNLKANIEKNFLF